MSNVNDTNRTDDRILVEKFCEMNACALFDYGFFCVVEIEKE